MKAVINRESFAAAFNAVSGVVPTRTPKPVLQSVKLEVGPEGAVLSATDLEIGIRREVLGVEAEGAGAVLLPADRLGAVLRASDAGTVHLEVDGDAVVIREGRSKYRLPTEDPATFPAVPGFDATAYHVAEARDLKSLIRRTSYATDLKNANYALGGCLLEFDGGSMAMIATDGRRLARAKAPASAEGEPAPLGLPVIPIKALKVIDRNLEEEGPPIHIAIRKADVAIRTGEAVIVARLVEGRFPRYQDIIPSSPATKAVFAASALRSAFEKAAVTVSETSMAVEVELADGLMKLASRSDGAGATEVEMPVELSGPAAAVAMDHRFVTDMTRAIGDADLTFGLSGRDRMVAFRSGEDFLYVLATMSRD